MAEFRELVRTKQRICRLYKNNYCNNCPVKNDLCGIISICSHSDLEFKALEDTLMDWAAEHPEPVYPTWGEWLQEIGVAQVGSGMLSIHPAIAEQPIPASFAQEHGIEPKEARS